MASTPGFLIQGFSEMFAQAAKKDALAKAAVRDEILSAKFRKGTSRWKLSRKDDHFLRSIRVTRRNMGRPIWSNRHVRLAATDAFIDVMLEDYAAHPLRERFFGTFAWDAGFTWERKPDINLIPLQRAVDKALRKLKLNALCTIEVDSLTQITGEPGRRLMFHVHCYCWTDGGSFKPKKAAKALRATKRFPNNLGARSVDFRKVTLTNVSVARLAEYMTKQPSAAKNRVPSRKYPGQFRMRTAQLTPDSAVRLVEVLSHMHAYDAVFSVLGGTEMSRTWRKAMVVLTNSRRGKVRGLLNVGDVGDAWVRIRQVNGSHHLKPCRIITHSNVLCK